MQRPPLAAVRNIAPSTQIATSQYIRPNQQQPILRAQTTAFPLTLTQNNTINPSYVMARDEQGQFFLVPPSGQSPLAQLQTQSLQTQSQATLTTQAQRQTGQIIRPSNNLVSGQVIVMSTNTSMSTATRPVIVQTQQDQLQSPGSGPRLPAVAGQRLMPSSTPTQQVRASSVVVLQSAQGQQQAMVRPIQIASTASVPSGQAAGLQSAAQDKEIMANVKKCKNFLSTLLKLAANQPPETNRRVGELIQGLIDGTVTPEQFTMQLQKELRSSPQPNLIPFLKQSLPFLRQCLLMNRMQIDGIRPPATSALSQLTAVSSSSVVVTVSPDNGPTSNLVLPPEVTQSTPQQESTVIRQQLQMPQVTQPAQQQQQQQSRLLLPNNVLNNAVTSAIDNRQPRFIAPNNAAGLIRGNVRPNQIQVQVQQQLPQSTNRLQLHQLVQQPLIAAMQNNTNFIAPTQPSTLSKFIISQNAALLQNTNQTTSNGTQPAPVLPQINSITQGVQLPTQKGEKRKYDAIRDDDDIMDVAAMGGVNLNEETKNILAHTSQLSTGQMRSCKDEMFLNMQSLSGRLQAICQKKGVTCNPEVLNLLSLATKDRLAGLVEKLAVYTSHRLHIYKNDENLAIKNEVRRQIKFRQDLARLEGERVKEQESRAIIKAAKSRTKSDDPEQLKKKELAKKQQQQEMEDKVKEQSNLTALAAIGPRRQKTSIADAPGHLGTGGTASSGLLSTSQALSFRARIKRAILKDMLCVMDGDKHLRNSLLYYKASLGLIQ